MNKILASNLKVIWTSLSSRRRKNVFVLLILMIFAAIAEVVSVASLIPFLTVILSPEKLINQPVVVFLKLDTSERIVFYVTFFFTGVIGLAMLARVLLIKINSNVSFGIGADLGVYIFSNILNRSYSFHKQSNSSSIFSALTTKIDGVIFGILIPVLTIISSLVISVPIIFLLIYINFEVALFSIMFFVVIYFLILNITKNKISNNSEVISVNSTQSVQVIQEALGSIRNIIIDNQRNYFEKLYERKVVKLRGAQSFYNYVSVLPRYVVEAIGMIFIALLAYYLIVKTKDSAYVLSVVGILALAAQRLLPLFQQIYGSWVSIGNNFHLLNDLVILINKHPETILEKKYISEVELKNHLNFDHDIALHNVDFNYKNKIILNNINLEVKKGCRVGIVGKTGGGKSTLLDILMGLLSPSKGVVSVDGNTLGEHNLHIWQSMITHVPQQIYLTASSIKANIAFAVDEDKIDMDRVEYLCKLVDLDTFISSLPEAYETLIGENGSNLSGGQRQRIAIARALYRNKKIIFFDEATSALDEVTEKKVIDGIRNLSEDFTIFMITHKHKTLDLCDVLIEVDNGNIKVIKK